MRSGHSSSAYECSVVAALLLTAVAGLRMRAPRCDVHFFALDGERPSILTGMLCKLRWQRTFQQLATHPACDSALGGARRDR